MKVMNPKHAIRERDGDPVGDFRESTGVPIRRSNTGRPGQGPFSLPSTGSPSARVPPFHRYYGAMRLLDTPLAALRFLRAAIPRLVRWFRSRPLRTEGPSLELVSRCLRPGMWSWMCQVSHVPGESSCALALLFDPGRTCGPGPTARRRGPHSGYSEGSLHCEFRGSIARLRHSLSTPHEDCAAQLHRSHLAPCKTRFRLPASSTGRDWLPAGFQRKVSECVSLHTSSSFPKFLRGANPASVEG